VARVLRAKDPGVIVVDEFAGQFLASAPIPLFRPYSSFRSEALIWIASFLFFRLFDVWKPGPIRRLQDLPEGWGIVVDDIAAGLAAAAVVVILLVLAPTP
jgi:phosphatidylglycerophosphatase A